MFLRALASALAFSASAAAFSDTAPFFLLSTDGSAKQPNQDRIQTSSQVESAAREFLKLCPTRKYVVVSQPNLHASDLQDEAASPSLHAVLGQDYATRWMVEDVYGDVSPRNIASYIVDVCAAMGREAELVRTFLPALPAEGEKRRAALRKNDDEIAAALRSAKPKDCTVVYVASAAVKPQVEEPISHELRRRIDEPSGQQNATPIDRRPVFEKYHFFWPGVFMALVATLIFLALVRFSIRTISNVQISYNAFEKDMGPNQQQKKQQ